MNLFTYRKKTNNQLPPLLAQPKAYTIRKSSRSHYSSVRSCNPDSRIKPNTPDKSVSRSKQDTPIFPYSLKDFDFGKCIGRGKGGRVITASLNYRDYALKIIPKELSKYALIESQILEKLSNPFIVKYFGRLEDEENIYIVLELINGCDLFHTMRKKRLKIPEVINISAQVLITIETLHNKGIVYRDLKPENIMISDNGNAKLIDFGLAKEINNDRAHTICGSPEYMAPEVIRKNAYTYAVDFWALGILLYEMLCGHPPFQGESYPEICQNILRGSFEFTRSVDPVSKDLIRRLLHTEPAYRLGNLQGKAMDVKKHKFFREISWDIFDSYS
ncbi:hypothetical protein SteCoe_22634 [Stentor coeruleus]|uniref:Protein kinase domain-containing protein n=1 Tax=Stentor coeruleus TaxID=5963 RepID=A0A1R2BLT2_9CILI|nr:hypothetical protein SteCoe_22634 [Stentor coeruleus]